MTPTPTPADTLAELEQLANDPDHHDRFGAIIARTVTRALQKVEPEVTDDAEPDDELDDLEGEGQTLLNTVLLLLADDIADGEETTPTPTPPPAAPTAGPNTAPQPAPPAVDPDIQHHVLPDAIDDQVTEFFGEEAAHAGNSDLFGHVEDGLIALLNDDTSDLAQAAPAAVAAVLPKDAPKAAVTAIVADFIASDAGKAKIIAAVQDAVVEAARAKVVEVVLAELGKPADQSALVRKVRELTAAAVAEDDDLKDALSKFVDVRVGRSVSTRIVDPVGAVWTDPRS
jgi:hypothetical protein